MPPIQKPVTPPSKPKLVNRGPAGLLSKKSGTPVPSSSSEKPEVEKPKAPVNHINQALRKAGLVTKLDKLIPDPENARKHPERNMESIKASLGIYGQLKPVVVRKQTMHIVAGNGTCAAAKELGWTEIAAVVIDMSEVEAAGYGLADNRTAELAKWDFEVVARLDKLLQEAGQEAVGWSKDELEVLRAADWTPPTVDEGAAFGGGGGADENDPLLVSFTPEEYEQVGEAIALMRAVQGKEDLPQAGTLRLICSEWSKAERGGWNEKMQDSIENGLDVNGDPLQPIEAEEEEVVSVEEETETQEEG